MATFINISRSTLKNENFHLKNRWNMNIMNMLQLFMQNNSKGGGNMLNMLGSMGQNTEGSNPMNMLSGMLGGGGNMLNMLGSMGQNTEGSNPMNMLSGMLGGGSIANNSTNMNMINMLSSMFMNNSSEQNPNKLLSSMLGGNINNPHAQSHSEDLNYNKTLYLEYKKKQE